MRSVADTATPSRSRPGGRSARVVAATHAAALEILGESGYEGLQLVDVAKRAQVHKTTIYRRWPTKAALVGDLLSQFTQLNVATPDSGSLHTDLELLLTDIASALADPAIRAVLHAAVAVGELREEVRSTRAQFWDDRFGRSGAIVEKAADRGEIPPDTDARALLEMAASPIYFRTLLTDDPVDAQFIAFIASHTIRAFGT